MKFCFFNAIFHDPFGLSFWFLVFVSSGLLQEIFEGQFTMSDDERDEKELDLTSPDVVTKYKSAAEIVNSIFNPYNFFSSYFCCCWFWFIIFFGFMLNPQQFSQFNVFFYLFWIEQRLCSWLFQNANQMLRLLTFARKGIHLLESKFLFNYATCNSLFCCYSSARIITSDLLLFVMGLYVWFFCVFLLWF